jgi:hypothetical protein
VEGNQKYDSNLIDWEMEAPKVGQACPGYWQVKHDEVVYGCIGIKNWIPKFKFLLCYTPYYSFVLF